MPTFRAVLHGTCAGAVPPPEQDRRPVIRPWPPMVGSEPRHFERQAAGERLVHVGDRVVTIPA